MRAASVLLTGAVLATTGCSLLVVNSGKNLGDLKTREQAHEVFGPPIAAGESDGQPYEEFASRRKVAEPWQNEYLLIGYMATAGLGELIWFPKVLYREGRRVIVGQQIRVTYDASGAVAGVRIDGDPVPWWFRGCNRLADGEQPKDSPEGTDSGIGKK